jgi:hypothetical protein
MFRGTLFSGRSVAIVSGLLVAASCGSSAHALTYADLEKITRDAVASGDVEIDEPWVTVERGVLRYYVGMAAYALVPGTFDKRPIDHAIENQMIIEVIRRYRPRLELRRMWEPAFDDMIPFIRQQLEVAQTKDLAEQDRLQKLNDLDQQVYQALENGVDRYARGRGLRAEPQAAAPPGPAVELVSSPAGGRIFLMHTMEYSMAKAEQRKPVWTEISEPSVQLGGSYWYSVKWDDRKVVGPKPVRVSSPGTITIHNDGRYTYQRESYGGGGGRGRRGGRVGSTGP